MKPQGIENNIKQLNKIAFRIINEMEIEDDQDDGPDQSDEDTLEEVKRLVLNVLNGVKMTTPELRRYFKLSNAEIWKIMSELEDARKIERAGKKGRAVLWTIANK
jgi:predicted HTH transcriptional regulator